MRIRDLHDGLVPAWPPYQGHSSSGHLNRRVDGRGHLAGVTVRERDGVLALDIQLARGPHLVILRWDRPQSLCQVAELLLAHLGRVVTALGDLEIPGVYGSEVRQRARLLLDGVETRREWLALFPGKRGVAPFVPRTVIATAADSVCDLCDDYGPQVAHHQGDGRILRLHAACQAIWLEECDRAR